MQKTQTYITPEVAKSACENSPTEELLECCQTYVRLDTGVQSSEMSLSDFMSFLISPPEERKYTEEVSPDTRLVRDVHYAELACRIALANNIEVVNV